MPYVMVHLLAEYSNRAIFAGALQALFHLGSKKDFWRLEPRSEFYFIAVTSIFALRFFRLLFLKYVSLLLD